KPLVSIARGARFTAEVMVHMALDCDCKPTPRWSLREDSNLLNGKTGDGTGWEWRGRAKVAVDFCLALVILILALPVFVLAALAVKLTSRGPIFYCQTRTGKGGRPYTIYKIRSMRHDCESKTGACWSLPGDSRITLVGYFLRHTHVDELPQLWNVIRGDMSLVGPRPERPEFVGKLAAVFPDYHKRLAVRPGVSGLAQIQLPADTDLESVWRKLLYDLYYVEHRSLW